jgi:hypothetical protein
MEEFMKKSAEEIIEGLSDKDIGDIDDGYKEYLKRLSDIKTYFDDARKLLVRNGWKEHTAFDKKSKDNFTKIIINRKYAS